MASPEEQVIANTDGNKVPLLSSKSQERSDILQQTDNQFDGFTSADFEISSSKALCSKFYVNHRERVSKELEQRIFLRNDLSCVKCQLTFSSTSHVEKHNEFCGKFSVFVPGTIEYLTQNGEKLRENASDMLICPWCPVLCAHTVALRKHISICKEANKKKNEKKVVPLLSCPECPVGYLSLLDLLYHLHCHYIGDIQCSRCSRSFSTTSSLVSHLNKCDMKRVFICGDCQSLFRDSMELQHHLKSCESKTQCLKCAKVIGSRRLSMDHIILHLLEEWSKSGFEMDDGTLYSLPQNQIKESKADAPPKHKFRRRKKLKSKFWTHSKTLASSSSNFRSPKQSMPLSENLQDASTSFAMNPHSKTFKEPCVLTKKRKSSAKDSKSYNGNISEITESCTGLNGAEADSIPENFSGLGNEMYEIENDICESECILETESFPTELLPQSHIAGMDDKDPLEFDTNSLFTPSLEGNDGLSLTVVNVEGGAHLFNWDDENDSSTSLENTQVGNLEQNLVNGKCSNISEVSSSCVASYKETFDEVDENEDRDSGIDATEDGDSNKDKTEDLDNQLEPVTNKDISSDEVFSNGIPSHQNECKSTSEAAQLEEVVNSEVFVSTEVTVSSEGGDSKPKKYSVVEEHSYCLPKGQDLPWFKIRTLHNKKLREEKKRELILSKDDKLETCNPANLNASKKLEPQETRRRIAQSSKIKVKGVKSILTCKKLSKSGLKLSVKALFSRQGTRQRVKKISRERTVFGEVCENLLLMAPESSSVVEHSNTLLVSESSKLSTAEKIDKSAFGEACGSPLSKAPENLCVKEQSNSALEQESCAPSSVVKNIKNDYKEMNRETRKDYGVLPIELGKDISDKKKRTNSTCSVPSSINITAETPVDICNTPKCKDLMEQPLEPVLDSSNVLNSMMVDEANGRENLEMNNSDSPAKDFIAIRQNKENKNSNGKVVNLPSLVPVIQNNTVIGYFMASFPSEKVEPNVTTLQLSQKSQDQDTTNRLTEAKETFSNNTISLNVTAEKQNCFDTLLAPLPKEKNLSVSSRVVISQRCPIPIGDEDYSSQVNQAGKKSEEISLIPPNEKGEDLFHPMETLSAQEKMTLPTFLEKIPKTNSKKTSREQNERLRNYRKERSMLSCGFKQIATLFPWKNSASSVANPLEEISRPEADLSKPSLAKTSDRITFNSQSSLSTSTVSSDDGVFKTSLKKLTSELNMLYLQELEVRRLRPPSHNVKSIVVEVHSILIKYKKLLNKVPISKPGDDFFKYQLKDFLADLLSILDRPYCMHGPDRGLLQEDEDNLTTGLRQLVSKCSDTLIDLDSEAPDSGTKCLPATKPYSGPECLPPTKSLMFVVASDGSLQPHPNFQSSASNESLNNVPSAVRPLGLPPCIASTTFDVLTNEIPAKENVNICTLPVKSTLESESYLEAIVQREEESVSRVSPCLTKPKENDSANTLNIVEAVQSENVEQCHVVMSSSAEDKKEERSTKNLTSVDFLQAKQSVKSLENCGVKIPCHEDAKKNESKKTMNEFDLFQIQHSLVHCDVTMSSDKDMKAEISNTLKGSNDDVLEVLQSVPNLEHYDVVLMSSSDEDTDNESNFGSCSSHYSSNHKEEALEKHNFSVCSTNKEKHLAPYAVITEKSQFNSNVSGSAATSQNEDRAMPFYTGLTSCPDITNDSNDNCSLRETAFSKLFSTTNDGLDSSKEEPYDKIMHSSLEKAVDNSPKPSKGTEESCGLVLDANGSLDSKQEEPPERFIQSGVEKANSPKLNKGTKEQYGLVIDASTKQNRKTLANDSKEADITETDVCSNPKQMHLMGSNNRKSANIPQKYNANNSILKKKITEESIPTESKVVNTPLKSLFNDAVLVKLGKTDMFKTKADNFTSSISNSALQLKLTDTNSSQKKFVTLNDGQSKMVKSSLRKRKDVRKHLTKAGGSRKWLSHFRVSSFLYRKSMPGMRYFRRKGMGREGLQRVTKKSVFACKQCPLWFYTQRDLERLHVCSRLILEKKLNSDQFDRFFDGKINVNVLEERTELKEAEDLKRICGLQEDSKVEEKKANSDFPKSNISQESLLLKETTEDNGLSPFETYVRMKKMRNFSCDKCPLAFKSFSTLHAHKSNVHTDALSLECHICGKQFSRLQKLAVHCAKSHKMSIKSENCNKSFQIASSNISSTSVQVSKEVPIQKSENETSETNQMKVSPLKAKVKSYPCKICNRAFLGSGGLQSHINQAHSTLHKCSLCPRRFTYFERLQKHYLDLHPGSVPNLLQQAVPSLTESQTDTTKERKDIGVCEKSTNKQEAEGCNPLTLMDTCADPSLKINMSSKIEPEASQNRSKKRKKTKWRIVNDETDETHGPEKGNKTPKLSDERSLVISFSKIKKSQYKCMFCSESFKRHQSLVHHLSDSHRNGPFSCTVCHMEQMDALQLQLHFNKCKKSKFRGKSAINHVTSLPGPDIPLTCSKVNEIVLNERNEGANKTSNVPDNNEIDLSKNTCAEIIGKTAFEEDGLSKVQVAEELEEPTRGSDQSQLVAQERVDSHNLSVDNTNQQISAPKCDSTSSNIKFKIKSNQAGSNSIDKDKNSLVRKPTWIRKGGWKCQICQKDFGAKGFLERHCIKSHGAPAKYNCPYCGKIFIDYRSLRIHHKTKHGKKKWLSVERSQTDHLPLSTDHSEPLCSSETLKDQIVLKTCSICGKGFRRNIDLRRHKNRHRTAVTCLLCNFQFETKKALAYHNSQLHAHETFDKKTISSQPVTNYSNLSSSSGSSKSLDNHIERNSLNPSSPSQEMDKATPHLEEVVQKPLSRKNSSVVGITEEFKCADCPLSYKKYSCLKRHRILMHAEPASYYCKICGKGFSYPHSLKNHVMTHSRGELNSKRSDRYAKDTQKRRSADQENLEVFDSSLEKNVHQDSEQEKSFPSTGSAENHAPLNVSKEPLTEDNSLTIMSLENGDDCLSPNDCEAKSNGQESLDPENKKKTDSSNVPFNSESEEKTSCPNSGVITPHTTSVTDVNVSPAILPWNGVIPNAFPPSNYPTSSHPTSSYSPSSFTTNYYQWKPNLQSSEALNTCSICGLCLPSWHGLQEHFSIAHPDPNVYALPVTYQTFPQDYATYKSYGAYHEGSFPIHPAVPFDNGSSSSFQELTSHSVAHCSVCGLCFPNLLALQEHYASHMASLSACGPVFQSAGFY